MTGFGRDGSFQPVRAFSVICVIGGFGFQIAVIKSMIKVMTRIAVVDDNSDNRLIIRTILEDQFEIMEFSSGIEAIEGFKKEKPNVVILDISLPEMDGTEILRRIREDPDLCDLPVIALTAHAMVGDREKYLSAGFNDYLAKPILDMSVLFSTIQRWVSA